MDELPIGRRVAYWRLRRNLSQQVFADRLGKSKSWVDKVERGVRRLDKFSVLHDIAEVLQIDAQMLMGKEPSRRPDSVNCVDQVEVEEIRSSLECYDSISPFLNVISEPPLPVVELEKSVNHAWATFQHVRYGTLARLLPRLISDAQAADRAYRGSQEEHKAASLLAQVYMISSSALRKLGEHELCWLAADRAINVSQRAGDPLLTGLASMRVANALRSLGRHQPALELNVAVANQLAPADDLNPDRLSVFGILLLQGAMAAAHLGDNAGVKELLDQAEETAKVLGKDDNRYWTCFGPTNVQLHRAAAAVEMGEGKLATEIHKRIDMTKFDVMLTERRATHLVDQARGYTQYGDMDGATTALLEAHSIAPSEVLCRPLAHEVAQAIVRRSRGAAPQPIAELVEQMGTAA
ncbi:helix-turn-helix domain-containing protein [Longispora albida]|uniref:helix-turn-helix domain-containing protein n=1 Tax=Longispora albida TaxID=203523 RepID=UPI0004754148|nr:helix-turn-helix domain-containing protein [Longispora albida]